MGSVTEWNSAEIRTFYEHYLHPLAFLRIRVYNTANRINTGELVSAG